MTIPKHNEIRLPILNLLKNGAQIQIRDFVGPMANCFNLTEEEKSKKYASGQKDKFANRVFWALSYLNMSSLIQKPKRGVYEISEKGLELLKTPDRIDTYIKKKLTKRKTKQSDKKLEDISEKNSELTPREVLSNAYEEIQQSIFSEILDTILLKSPKEFEGLVVQLLQKMGYGGKLKNSGIVTQYSNDKGIDGIIKEDVLGLGRIHIQAKRYKQNSNVPREDIQKFVGALAVAQSNKGVFITTSNFTKGANEYVKNLNATTTIVLINGEKLAKFIYDFGLGMQVEETIEIKKLDSDFWDNMEDEKVRS
ncbi:MAG: restriction endonuclease [Bacteroidetes bacterium]|nr:restriction endonuclease [Bacteroidota bacterium]